MPVIVQTWENVMVTILRGLIGDTNPTTPMYSDSSLKSIITIAGVMTTRECDFHGTTYTIDVENVTISPDPVTLKDHDFVGLVCLKAAVFIADGEYRNSARLAISHRDGPSHVDAKGVAENLAKISKMRAEQYEAAKIHYEVGDGSLGKAIVGPYNAFISAYNASNQSLLNSALSRASANSFFS